jgi:hypothetical protein
VAIPDNQPVPWADCGPATRCACGIGVRLRHAVVRGVDYVEVSLTSTCRYNPLYNDLEAYALAYSIATLMINLYGRGKEPFWQQASTNLIKFVILLHQTLEDYVMLFQVSCLTCQQSQSETWCVQHCGIDRIGSSWER